MRDGGEQDEGRRNELAHSQHQPFGHSRARDPAVENQLLSDQQI